MLFDNPDIFQVDDDGFVPPNMGGTVAVKVATVEYTDTTAKDLFTLPSGAVPLGILISVVTDFDDSTGDTLEIGANADADYFGTGIDVSTAGNFDEGTSGFIAGRFGTQLTEETVVTCSYTETTGDASQGEANIIMFYMLGGSMYVAD